MEFLMGLDQYAFARFGDQKTEIAYWRKHANLEGWMADLYRVKTGDEEVFNCKELVLDKHDIKMLEQDYKNLATAAGFFWGESYPEDDATVAEFIVAARALLESGHTIIYTSWW